MKIAIYGRSFDNEFVPAVGNLFRVLESRNVDVLVHKTFNTFLEQNLESTSANKTFSSSSELKSCDFLLSIGGDGTLLNTVTLVRDSGIPILGINTGRLGFLSHADVEKVEEAIGTLLNGKFSIDHRSLIRVEASGFDLGDFPVALNEATLLNKERNSMIAIHVNVNEHYMSTYWADGLIIATPTGSTAYSLSCGGPIVTPESRNIIVTPIAPHNLNIRPFVISGDDTISLRTEARDASILLSIDSRSYTIPTSTEIKLTRASFDIQLVRLPGQDFYATIRNKLGWAADKRN